IGARQEGRQREALARQHEREVARDVDPDHAALGPPAALPLEEDLALVADPPPASAAGGDAAHAEERAADHGDHVGGRALLGGGGRAHELILWSAVIIRSIAP